MKQFIPYDKRSKKDQKEHTLKQRGSWNGVNPVTKTTKRPNTYKRSKIKILKEAHKMDAVSCKRKCSHNEFGENPYCQSTSIELDENGCCDDFNPYDAEGNLRVSDEALS